MLKKHMTPIGKGPTTAHKGKGSQMASMPNRQQIAGMSAPGAPFSDYAKATPMAQPSPEMPMLPSPPGMM